jgi:hypothetical protein
VIFTDFVPCSFLLGVFEAAYGPGVPYLLSFFYLRHEVGFRSGIFLAGTLVNLYRLACN